MRKSTAPPTSTYPTPPDVARWRVVIPSPAEPTLAVVLTCGSDACRHTFEPDPVAFAAGRLSCGGWTFAAQLVEPTTAGAGTDTMITNATEALRASGIVQHGRCIEVIECAVIEVLEAAGVLPVPGVVSSDA